MKSILPLLCLFFLACHQVPQNSDGIESDKSDSKLYSADGQQHKVHFEAVFQTSYKDISELPDVDSLKIQIKGVAQFLMGPLIYRSLAGTQKGEKITPRRNKAFVKNGAVMVPYRYEGVWLIHKKNLRSSRKILLPVPYKVRGLDIPGWEACSESHDGHSLLEDLWYYWDPSRSGCTHVRGVHYQEVSVRVGDQTAQSVQTYPEYSRLIRMENGKPVLSMTFAFGYVNHSPNQRPFFDNEEGVNEFQNFHAEVEKTLLPKGFQRFALLPTDYGSTGTTEIGSRFVGIIDGVEVRVSIVSAAGIDQMDLFAHSYARSHEGFFGWFGHSIVGSGFDANRFEQMVRARPNYFSLTAEYQLVYWNGCNSYAYYTSPFFEQKAKLNPAQDPNGTKNLDLISNALPTYFMFNSYNAKIVFDALLNWKTPTSYQNMIVKIENRAEASGRQVIVNVLGDEDNQAP